MHDKDEMAMVMMNMLADKLADTVINACIAAPSGDIEPLRLCNMVTSRVLGRGLLTVPEVPSTVSFSVASVDAQDKNEVDIMIHTRVGPVDSFKEAADSVRQAVKDKNLETSETVETPKAEDVSPHTTH